MRYTLAEPCRGLDPACPCQDGDACNYVRTATTPGWGSCPVRIAGTGVLTHVPYDGTMKCRFCQQQLILVAESDSGNLPLTEPVPTSVVVQLQFAHGSPVLIFEDDHTEVEREFVDRWLAGWVRSKLPAGPQRDHFSDEQIAEIGRKLNRRYAQMRPPHHRV